MIFVCLGSQIFQFNRLVKELDVLVKNGDIKEEIVAQIGATDYIPKYFQYKRFMDKEEFERYQDIADVVISHGGTGALIGASKKRKNIIAVPRLAKFGEHVDDHQLQIVKVLESEGYIRAVYDINKLLITLKKALDNPISKSYNRKSDVLN
uniref:PssE/Cps14G family polysaccharide biosynthesis glycosyltransferase n=1 Tax=uncultured Phascolarctobacterium sp. TaxID=512296 RepID=UPI002635E68C